MSEGVLDAVVVGAGAAGLAAAAALHAAGRSLRVLEAGDRIGGSAFSERRDGWLVERGANTFRCSPRADAFVRRHGLDRVLLAAAPASRERFLLREGRLVPIPMGPAALVRTPLLSARGKLRLLAEPFARRGDATGETVAAFATRRFGAEACERLVAPFLTGVYAGDERRLGAEAVFPALVEAERRSGSVALGLLAGALRRKRPRGRAGTWSAAGGLGAIAAALAAPLGDALRLRARASRVSFENGLYHIETEGQSGSSSWRARGLVVALPPHAAAPLVAPLDSEAAEALAGIGTAPVVSVSLGIEADATRVPVRGFGFLVPRGELRGDAEALLGCLFPSCLFPDRAPPGRALLTVLAGGLRRPDALDWDEPRLLGAIAAALGAVLGLRGAPEPLAVTRWPRAVVQPGPDHPRRLEGLRRRLARFPRLALAGAGYDGVAFGDALASGGAAAAALTAEEEPPCPIASSARSSPGARPPRRSTRTSTRSPSSTCSRSPRDTPS